MRFDCATHEQDSAMVDIMIDKLKEMVMLQIEIDRLPDSKIAFGGHENKKHNFLEGEKFAPAT